LERKRIEADQKQQVKPRVNKAQTAVETAGVKHSMNPFDELSIEESVRIREKKSYPAGILSFRPLPVLQNSRSIPYFLPNPSSQLTLPPSPGVEEIIAFSIGPPKSADILRTAMAMGADRSIHIETKDGDEIEPLTVSKIIAKVVQKEKINLVMCGKQSIDDDAGQTGQMVAGLLGWGQATQASKVTFDGEGEGGRVVVEKE